MEDNDMLYSFSMNDAIKYGTDEAIMLYNFKFWLNKNKANNKHIHDGRVWTYNSVAAYTKLFPNWTYKQIRRILESLEKQEILITGNYNKIGYDKTKWYSINSPNYVIEVSETNNCPNGQMSKTDNCPNGTIEQPKKEDYNSQKGKPIPDNKPVKKTHIYSDDFKNVWKLFLELVGKGGDKKTGYSKYIETIKEYSADEIEQAVRYYANNVVPTKETKFIKTGAYFFDKDYIEEFIIAAKKKVIPKDDKPKVKVIIDDDFLKSLESDF